MKHSKLHQALAMATVLGGASVGLFAPSAGAVNLSQQGLGEVLIFPYYTSRDNWSTLLSVINTQDTTLAVRFRIHEARNSRDVQDFTVVLSPYDVFAGTISADTAGLTSFTPASGDKTCIVADGTKPSPYVYPTTIPFKVSGFTSGNTDGGPGIEYPANPLLRLIACGKAMWKFLSWGTRRLLQKLPKTRSMRRWVRRRVAGKSSPPFQRLIFSKPLVSLASRSMP